MYAHYWRTIPNTQVVNVPCKCDGKSKQNCFICTVIVIFNFCYFNKKTEK